MSIEKLDSCFKCHKDNVHFILMSTNSRGGQVFKIKCEDCGLCSVEESLRERLVKWWNDREFKMPPDNIFNILKAIEAMDKTLGKSGKPSKAALEKNLAEIKEQLGLTEKGGS